VGGPHVSGSAAGRRAGGGLRSPRGRCRRQARTCRRAPARCIALKEADLRASRLHEVPGQFPCHAVRVAATPPEVVVEPMRGVEEGVVFMEVVLAPPAARPSQRRQARLTGEAWVEVVEGGDVTRIELVVENGIPVEPAA
jgi:hypothetical protein